jgi:hypothetical protein
MDARGAALASWTGRETQVALRPGPNGSWRAPVAPGSQPGGTGDIAITSLTRAVAVWQQPNDQTGGTNVDAAAYNGPT